MAELNYAVLETRIARLIELVTQHVTDTNKMLFELESRLDRLEALNGSVGRIR